MSVNSKSEICTIDLDYNSVIKVCQGSRQAMVYGNQSCKYAEVFNTLALDPRSPVLKVYNYLLGCYDKDEITLEGRPFYKIRFPLSSTERVSIARKCKAGIINLVFENFKRKQLNLPTIPLIFCIDIDGKESKDTFKTIFARTPTKGITNSELRLCHKLCSKLKSDPILSQITGIARETLKFVKVVDNGVNYELEAAPTDWDNEEWEAQWNQRQETKLHETKWPVNGWRSQLKRAMRAQQSETISKKRKVESSSTEPSPKKIKTTIEKN
jgi:hypothetical protein